MKNNQHENEHQIASIKEKEKPWQPENVIEIDKTSLNKLVEKICKNGGCRYPLLALRILIHVITSIDAHGKVYISARHLAKLMDAHYDTVTKCLKHLREIGVLHNDCDQ